MERKYVKTSLNEGNPYDRPVANGKIYDPNEATGGGPMAPDEFVAVSDAVTAWLKKMIIEQKVDPDDAVEILYEHIVEIASEFEDEYEQQGEDEDFDNGNLTDTEKLDKKYPYPKY